MITTRDTSSILQLIETDVLDTMSNNDKVASALSAILSSDGISSTDLLNQLSSLNATSITAMISDTPYRIQWNNIAQDGIEIFPTLTDGYTNVQKIGEVVSGTVKLNEDVLEFPLDNTTLSLSDIADSIGEGCINSEMIYKAITSVSSISPRATFEAYISKYGDNLSSNSKTLRSMLSEALSQANPSQTLSLALANIYSNLGQASTDGTTGFQLADKQFYVQGFCGEVILNAASSLVTGLATAVLTAINPILGVITNIVGQIVSGVKGLLSQVSETYCNIDFGASDVLYAQCIGQCTLATADVPYNFREKIKTSGSLLVKTGSIAIQFIDYPANSTIGVYVFSRLNSLYMPTRFYENSEWPLSPTENTLSSNIYWPSAASLSCYWLPFSNIVNFNNRYYDDEAIRLEVLLSCMQVLCLSKYSGGSYSYSFEGSTSISWSSTMSDKELLKVFAVAQLNSYTHYNLSNLFNSIVTWEHLVNSIIPSVSAIFLAHGLDNSWLNYIINYGGATFSSTVCLFNGVINESDIRFTPPSYSKGALFATLCGMALVAVSAAIISFTAYKVKRWASKKVLRKQTDIEALKYRYENDPTEANWNAYYGSIRSYNRVSGILGGSKLSLYNGQEIGSSESIAKSYNVDYSGKVIKLISG